MSTTGTPPRSIEPPDGPPDDLDDSAEESRRPRRLGVIEAARTNWPWVAVPVLLTVVLAFAVGLTRTPTYTAESRLVVGGTTANTSLTQSVLGNQTLASVYARLITSDPVTTRIANETGSDQEESAASLSASPIPESPIIRVEATADTDDKAIDLANAASAALVETVSSDSQDTTQLDVLLRQVSTAEREANDARVVRDRAQRRFDASPTQANERRLNNAEGNLRAAQLKVNALSEAYQQETLQRTGDTSLEVLNPARSATSDRSSTLQTLVVIGLLGGLAIGLALAAYQAARSGRR